jgi:hypothetical protein
MYRLPLSTFQSIERVSKGFIIALIHSKHQRYDAQWALEESLPASWVLVRVAGARGGGLLRCAFAHEPYGGEGDKAGEGLIGSVNFARIVQTFASLDAFAYRGRTEQHAGSYLDHTQE